VDITEATDGRAIQFAIMAQKDNACTKGRETPNVITYSTACNARYMEKQAEQGVLISWFSICAVAETSKEREPFYQK
jgi:hypothetical protein